MYTDIFKNINHYFNLKNIYSQFFRPFATDFMKRYENNESTLYNVQMLLFSYFIFLITSNLNCEGSDTTYTETLNINA